MAPISRMYARPPPWSAAADFVAGTQPMMVSGRVAVPANDRLPPQPTMEVKPPLPLDRYRVVRAGAPRLSWAPDTTKTFSRSRATPLDSMTSAPCCTRSVTV